MVLPAAQVMQRLTPDWAEFASRPRNRVAARVVMSRGEILAIGSMSKNSLHPEPRYLDLLLADSADPACLSPLLDALVADLGEEGCRPVHFSIAAEQVGIEDWATSNGFEVIRTTWSGVLNPPVLLAEPAPRFSRLSDGDSPELRKSLTELHAQIYRRQHDWNPPATITSEMAMRLFMSEHELLPEYMWYAVDAHGDPNGAASLRRTGDSGVLDFGWIGVLPGVDPEIHRQLFEAAMSAADAASLLFEVDDNDAITLELCGDLPVVWTKKMLRFRRPGL